MITVLDVQVSEHVGIYLQCERHLSLPSTKKKLQSLLAFWGGQPHIKHLCCSDPFTEAASFVGRARQGSATGPIAMQVALWALCNLPRVLGIMT